MVQDIKGSGGAGIGHTTAAGEPTVRPLVGGTARPDSPASAATDVVTLTDLAARLQRLTEAVAQVPVVDQAKVEALRAEIENGQYRIDERAVADKLSALEAMLDGTRQA